MNFVYQYGPPLFNPHDDLNTPQSQGNNNLTNTLCAVTGSFNYAESNPDLEKIRQEIEQYIDSNLVKTCQIVDPNDGKEFGGASAYVDSRARSNVFAVSVKNPRPESKTLYYKITFPRHLGGTVFNKFMPIRGSYPEISENFVVYNLKTSHNDIISDVLTQTLSTLQIENTVDPSTGSYIQSYLGATFLNLNRTDVGLKILQFMWQNVCVIRISAGYKDLYPYFEGMIETIDVDESLDKTEITITAHDLLKQVFNDPDTLIYSLVNIRFPGMKFNKIIEFLHEYTELYHHFAYDLGDYVPGTIYYRMYSPHCKDAGIPKIVDSMAVANLGAIQIAPYSTDKTYFKCLQAIRDLLLQPVPDYLRTNTNNPCKPKRFDVPIFYWYHDGKKDGIIMSSRTLLKDRDVFYLRSAQITDVMTKNIQWLHGYIQGSEGAFTSESNSKIGRAHV